MHSRSAAPHGGTGRPRSAVPGRGPTPSSERAVLPTGGGGARWGPCLATPTPGYWHKSAADNAITRQIVWRLAGGPSGLSPGAYTFGLDAFSRAFEPGDGHVYTPTNPDVGYNPGPIWLPAHIAVAIVD